MSDNSTANLSVADPLSVGLLNADSAFLLDEKYYLDDNEQGSEGLVHLVQQLGAISREEITTGSLNLFFKSHRKGIPPHTRETIRVVLPTLRSFAENTQRLTRLLLSETEKRTQIIEKEIKPLKIGIATMEECRVFQENLLSQLFHLLEIYHRIYKDLNLLAQLSEEQEELIMYVFFHLKKDSVQTNLQEDIIRIETDFERAFQILGKIHGFIGRLKKRIGELEQKIIPDTRTIEITPMDDF